MKARNAIQAAAMAGGFQGRQAETIPSEDGNLAVPIMDYSHANTLNQGEHLGPMTLKGKYLQYLKLELLAYARSRFGEDCLKVLRAAIRAGKVQPAAPIVQMKPVAGARAYCESTIRRRTRTNRPEK